MLFNSSLRKQLGSTLMRSNVSKLLARSLMILTEGTPNPSTLKFKPVGLGKNIVDDEGGFDFRTPVSARRSPLARELLAIDGVSGVFIGKDFVAVTKKSDGNDNDIRWQQLKVFIFSTMMEFFDNPNAVAVLPPTDDEKDAKAKADAEAEEDTELVQMIKELLEEKVRPMAKDDGGDVIFKGFNEKEGVVNVQLVGSCVGCPSSTITLKNGVENMLRHYIPEVKRVDATMGGEGEEEDQTHHLSYNKN
jgi:Fe-S cluster biogenesis protein NfuA